MRFNQSIRVALAVTAASFLGGHQAFAQNYGAYPGIQAGNARSGNNGNAAHSSPGLSLLNWSHPFDILTTTFTKALIDDTDTNPPTLAPGPPIDDGGPFLPNPYGFTFQTGPAGSWFGPPDPNGEADLAFSESIRNQPVTFNGTNYPINFNFRTPAYHMATCVKSISQIDPSLGATKSFSWRFTGVPTIGGTAPVPSTYAIWVNLPVGPTFDFTKSPATKTFPQQFFVYVIRYGPGGQSAYIDVVDTYKSGGGLVRLGAGGSPNNVVFPFDGNVNDPITVTLYNTVPMNPDGSPSMPGDPAQYVVYADMIRFDPNPGLSTSTPVATRLNDLDPTTTIVTDVTNEFSVGTAGITTSSFNRGVVYQHPYNGQPTNGGNILTTSFAQVDYNWRYSPFEEGPVPITMDNSGNMHDQFVGDIDAKFYQGPDAAVAPIIGQFGATPFVPPAGTVTYIPGTALLHETYDIYAFLPGDGSDVAHKYSHSTIYQISYDGGAGTMVNDYIPVDQTLPRGWTRIGLRRYPNTASVGLSVTVLDQSADATDAAVPLHAYSDAVRFIGEANHTLTSSAVHATVNILQPDGTSPPTHVTIVADENGVIHCLDAKGNPDGTTTEYWSYPSTRDSVQYDPNLGGVGTLGEDYGGDKSVPAKDRSPTAEMPQGFGLSSPLVVGNTLYIGSVNGRVYAIDCTGGGNFGGAVPDPISGGFRKVGTTHRVWTYPATFPSALPSTTSDLITISGSIAYGTPGGVGTIFVPTAEGRIYSLDAAGTPSDVSTARNWTFPLKDQADPTQNQMNLGPVTMTPMLAYNSVIFGVQQQQTTAGTLPGRFFSINWATGKPRWETDFAAFAGFTPTYPSFVAPLDFISSPATASNADLNPTTSVDTTAGLVYALNQNGVVYAIDSGTGAVQWATQELNSGSQAGLTFTWQTVYDNNGSQNPFPVVVVPRADGHFSSLFARVGDLNIFQGRLAWQRSTQGDSVIASMAVQDMGFKGTIPPSPFAWMYGADSAGYFYALTNTGGNFGNYGQPGGEDIVPNNPAGDVFHKVRIARLPNLAAFQLLRQAKTTATYDTVNGLLGPETVKATDNGFEWGQTIYVIVYRFPFLTQNTAAPPVTVDPPVVNISLSVNGRVVRGVSVQARQFAGTSPNYSAVPPVGLFGSPTDPPMDGYAVLAFPFQSSGANSLPPGTGEIDATISTSALNSSGIQQNVIMNPSVGSVGSGRFPFIVANPIAIVVPGPGASLDPTLTTLPAADLPSGGPNGKPANLLTYGITNNPVDAENISNGTFNVPAESPNGAFLGAATIDKLSHGGTGKLVFYVVDRSMMSLLRPDGLHQGLDNVRLDRTDVAWQGGVNAVIKPLNTSYYNQYAGFEDMPVNFPNDSLDYPDIHKQNVLGTKDPTGNPENPLFNGVTLLPPLDASSTSNNQVALSETSDVTKRILRPTPFEIDFNVPRFQPANLNGSNSIINSQGVVNPIQGYMGRLDVFVDSVPNGRLDTSVSEAYRSLNISTSVDVDERLSVTTPNVDLSSLASGAGYSPANPPGTGFVRGVPSGNNVFQPWGGGNFASIFQPFGVENDGNTNLLDLRLAKIKAFPNPTALTIASADLDPWAYLDDSFDLWSNLDPVFAAGADTNHRVFLMKARVQDRVPTTLVPNPVRRVNQNLGRTGTTVVGGNVVPDALNLTLNGTSLLYDPSAGANFQPRIGMSIPIGFPAGNYSGSVGVFENDNGDLAAGTSTPLWDLTSLPGTGTYQEPSTSNAITLSFRVVETRLTNFFSPRAGQLLDQLSPGGANGQFGNANIQPTGTRDALGALIMAWSSNRPSMTSSITTPDNGQYKIYVASLATNAKLSASQGGSITGIGGSSPLRDFDFWQQANSNQWFNPVTTGFPSASAESIFGVGTGESIVAGSARYGNPAFPATGGFDPFNAGTAFTGLYMPFTGEAQRQNADGSVQHESRLMLATVAAGGVQAGPFVDFNDDPLTMKGKPSVVQTGKGTNTALLFYPVSAGGQTTVLYNTFNGSAFGQASALPFGPGFSSIDMPSAVGRIANLGRTTQRNVVELSFAGKLRGRPYAEIYLGRLPVTGAGNDIQRDANGAIDFVDLPPVTNETLNFDNSQVGLYHAAGVGWDTTQPANLTQVIGGVTTNLLVPGTAVADPSTGVISSDTTLGGKVYFDPTIGTVRFSSSMPGKNAQLLFSYTPTFLRVSGAGNSSGSVAAFTSPSTVFDQRLITDPTFWFNADGSPSGFGSQNLSGNLLSNDRMVFTYNRSSISDKTGSRPFITPMRFGIILPFRLPTTTDGVLGVTNGNVTLPAIQSLTYADGGAGDAFQVDPATNKSAELYFPASDEGRTITVVQRALDDSGKVIVDGGGNPVLVTTTAVISLVPERTESPISIETSINESGLSAFLDPFSYANATPGGGAANVSRRPPVLFLLWSSTRFGSPDLYFQSIAPQWTPKLPQN